jgi:hypothetical protein
MLTPQDAFARWAPAESAWSDWVKPALFATCPPEDITAPTQPVPLPDAAALAHVPDTHKRTAIVIDLPGDDGLQAALALAQRGYRPVPLYNTTHGPKAAVDVAPIARALVAEATRLDEMRIKPDAPPAFVVDANRMPPGPPPSEGKFDNRWMVFPQDFPSATYLRARGIERALLVQDSGSTRVRDDLAHVLLRWQEAGIALQVASPDTGHEPQPLVVTKPPLYRRAWYRVLSVLKLRRNNVGGFGAIVPIAAAG